MSSGSVRELQSLIREIDAEIIRLIVKRLEVVGRVFEGEAGERVLMEDRVEQSTIDDLLRAGEKAGLKTDFVKRLAQLLVKEAEAMKGVEQATPISKDQQLKAVLELALKLEASGVKIVRMETGEPNFEPPRPAARAARRALAEKRIMGYGPASGMKELRDAIAEEVNEAHDAHIDPDQVLIVPGGRFGIFAAFSSSISPFDRVIIPQPAWPAYEECVNFAGGRVISIKTRLEDDWGIDTTSLDDAMKRGGKMLVLNSPNNPTGKVISDGEFEEIMQLARKHGVTVLSDEVYDRYVRERISSVLDYPDVDYIYINSFSKRFGMTGWRIAYAISSKERVMAMRRLLATAVTCVPEFVQVAALEALRKGRQAAQKEIEGVLRKVDLACKELDGIKVRYYKPDGAFYVFPKALREDFDSVQFAKYLLEGWGVAITPGTSFGEYPEFFRISVTLPASEVQTAVRAIGEAINAWPEGRSSGP